MLVLVEGGILRPAYQTGRRDFTRPSPRGVHRTPCSAEVPGERLRGCHRRCRQTDLSPRHQRPRNSTHSLSAAVAGETLSCDSSTSSPLKSGTWTASRSNLPVASDRRSVNRPPPTSASGWAETGRGDDDIAGRARQLSRFSIQGRIHVPGGSDADPESRRNEVSGSTLLERPLVNQSAGRRALVN